MTNTNNGDAATNSCAQRGESESKKIGAAEKPTGDLTDEQWIFDLAADHEARGNGLFGPVTFNATGLVEFTRAAIAAHLAGQSQATKAQAVPEGWKLVPVEPTEAMWEAWEAAEPRLESSSVAPDGVKRERWTTKAGVGWESMLAAAPVAPTVQEVAQQAAPAAVWTAEEIANACVKAGLGILECHGLLTTLKSTPAITQQAAKAETAEQKPEHGSLADNLRIEQTDPGRWVVCVENWFPDEDKARSACRKWKTAYSAAPLVKVMVDRFLGWKLPEDFYPDAGISFDRAYAEKWGMPSGTNLFHAGQAKAMFEHVLAAPTTSTVSASGSADEKGGAA